MQYKNYRHTLHYKDFAEETGDKVFSIIENTGNLSLFAWEVIKNILRGKVNFKLTLDQMVKVGIESLPLALITAAFIGMVFAMQIAGEFMQFGAGKFVGGVMSIAMARELGPAITGIVVAARVAAAFSAEIGTMKVTDQIDAMRALGVSPIRYLVIPRFIAAVTMLPLLTIFADVIGFGGSYVVATMVGKINPVQFMETAQSLMSVWDFLGGVLKAVIFGMIIAIIASYKGLKTKGGAKGVGEATTSSIVASLISLFIVNYFLSTLFFK